MVRLYRHPVVVSGSWWSGAPGSGRGESAAVTALQVEPTENMLQSITLDRAVLVGVVIAIPPVSTVMSP